MTTFDRFASSFHMTQGAETLSPWWDPGFGRGIGYTDLAERFAGATFDQGLYRIHDSLTGPKGMRWIAETFPDFVERAHPFGYDWLGRQFALDSGRSPEGEPLVLLLEPGTGEALEIDLTLHEFHEQLYDIREPALGMSAFNRWAEQHIELLPLARTECVGYGIPLFLGGKDSLQNLELIDIDVYWSVCGQLRQGIRQLPAGTSVAELAIGK